MTDVNTPSLLVDQREELIQGFVKNGAPEFLESFSRILDTYFQTSLGRSKTAADMTFSGTPVALVALGGYGRQEQCVHSDVDLLVLFEKKVPPQTEKLVQELLYPLWDARFETGYAVRTVKECLKMAWEQFDILTTMLDARFICGASPVYLMLMEKFRRQLSRKYQEKSLTRLIDNSRKRHEDYGDSTYLLEPDLKSGHGGLRDYHSLLWYARIKSDIRSRRDLERYGFLSHDEYRSLEESLTFIWHTRNWLHHLTGRKCDQLHFEHQVDVAHLLGFEDNARQKGVEQFMGELHAHMDFLKLTHQLATETILLDKKGTRISFPPKSTRIDGIAVRRRRLEFTDIRQIPKHPRLLMQIFVESGRSRTPLSIDARRIVSDFLHLVDPAFQKQPDHIKDFETILATSFWEFNVLNVMLSTGLLEQFIPEFTRIIHKIQYNQYHLFPVDKHVIRCVQEINNLKTKPSDSDDTHQFYNGIYREVRSKRNLRLAALLHDIGKGDPASEHSEKGAQIASNILERFGYAPADIKEICFLVRHHLTLMKTATRRDISDEETVVYCARQIGRVGRLRMLYLLTVADSRATGPKAWNEWTEILLKELFLKILGILKKGELASRRAARIIDTRKEEVRALKKDTWEIQILEKTMDLMPHRYLLHVPADQISDHLELYRQLDREPVLWKISASRKQGTRRVAVCGRDQPGFFSKMAGVFFLNGLNIIGSQAYGWKNGIALDIFRVMAPADRLFEDEKWEKTKADLLRALSDEQFLDRLQQRVPDTLRLSSGEPPIPNRINIDNDSSSFFTIIEVFTYDFPGLLFAITNALYRQGVDVRIVMAATKVDQVVDVFYVRSLNNGKLDEQTAAAAEKIILDALPTITSSATDP